jgi:hypothetical protein
VVALARVAEMERDGEEGVQVGTAAGRLLLCCRAWRALAGGGGWGCSSTRELRYGGAGGILLGFRV